MEKKQPRRHSFRDSRPHRWLAVAVGVVLALVFSATAYAQQAQISGTVTSAYGAPLRGVAVRVQGTEIRTLTDQNGRYTITAAPNAVITYSLLGQRVAQRGVGGRSTIDVTMEPIAFLEEVVVTAYTEQRRADITGAVSSMNVEAASRQTSASVLQRLDVTVPGVTVEASGSPGSRSTVRVRGVSSFQNNDPLYIVDGTPVQDTYVNWLNPNDIASVQVLKDASAASIYGARASNGVIVIETTKRELGAPRATLRVRTGMATPVRGYDDILLTNTLDYFRVVKQSYDNAGVAIPAELTAIYGDPNNPTIPKYMFVDNPAIISKDAFGRPVNVDESKYSYPDVLIMPASAGTNWWDAVFGTATIGDYNLDIAGGAEDNQYGVSFNYFDQGGTARFNGYKRGSARVNTAFNRGRLRFGENIAISADRANGGIANDPGGYAEDGILGKNILLEPLVPVYDIRGNFAGAKAPLTGNQSNPLKYAQARKDNFNRNERIFGNLFAGLDVNPNVQLRSKLGFNLAQRAFSAFNPIVPENSEESLVNSFNEENNQYRDWTWSNTANINRKFSAHTLSVLLGQEANQTINRFLTAGISGLLNTDVNSRFLQDALGDAASKNVSSTGWQTALLSFFGKADYNYADKYVLSFTLRQDGSSNLGPKNRWGTFPAFGLGWRLTQEPFFANNKLLSDVMLRFGWGVTGNQQIPAGRVVSQFGGSRGDTYYDIGGGNSIVSGFRQTSLGNPDLKWEENRSTNVGADIALWNGRVNVVVDVFSRKTNNLLFNPPIPATAGIADAPIVNIGKMENNGYDFSIGHRSANWSVTWNGSHYSNKIKSIDGVTDFFYGPITTRYGNQVINKVGFPIGSFYGLVADGYFPNAADAASHKTTNGTCAVKPCQDGAAMGRIRFKDTNGDGFVTLADRTVIGSPHPDFTSGLDLSARRGNWDLSGTVFGSFGNDIFDVQKEFYVFRNFSTNVRKDLLANSWTPSNPNAKYPRLDVTDNFSHQISSFYVEDGSYVRLRNVQLGYSVPPRFSRWTAASRVYLQAENLFTITGYDGLDPSLPAANITGPAGDIRDQYRGIDRGSYPSNRVISLGLVTTF